MKLHCIASWLGFKFADLKIKNMTQLVPEEVAALTSKPSGDGT
ncbi:unnamed protein product, partial [marine sediment metagenome]